MIDRHDEWAYRIPYAIQWMWPVPLAIGVFLAPESPWWLVRRNRIADAKQSLLRLTSLNRETNFDADETVAMMVHTTALEEKITSGASYFDCFRGVDLRRTEIVCMVWAIQNLSGNSFSGFSTYFLEQAGLPASTALDFALGQYGINMAGVFGAWFLMSLGLGRRTLYMYGLCGLCLMLLIMGFLGLPKDRQSASLATGSIMIVWALFYQLSVGTVCYSLVAEISTRRLQIKTVALGRIMYNIVAIICNVLTPYMLNPCKSFAIHRENSKEANTNTHSCMELGQLRGLLLGRHLLPLHNLHISARPGAAWPHLCRARPALRAEDLGAQLREDAGRCLRGLGGDACRRRGGRFIRAKDELGGGGDRG